MVTNSRFVGHSDITPSLAGNVRFDRHSPTIAQTAAPTGPERPLYEAFMALGLFTQRVTTPNSQ
jgi:hypothetical protein